MDDDGDSIAVLYFSDLQEIKRNPFEISAEGSSVEAGNVRGGFIALITILFLTGVRAPVVIDEIGVVTLFFWESYQPVPTNGSALEYGIGDEACHNAFEAVSDIGLEAKGAIHILA